MASVRSRYRHRLGPPTATLRRSARAASRRTIRARSGAASGLMWYPPSPNIGNRWYRCIVRNITVTSLSRGANSIVGRTMAYDSPLCSIARSTRRLSPM